VAAFLLLKVSDNVNGREKEQAMELDEVVVTATKMKTSIKVLASVSVIT
jgi:outer membrane cobalamin receptor